MWQRKMPEDKRGHRHILASFRPTGKERYRNAADKGALQVIAGHRGWRGADYFRHIDKLAVGDTVTLTNLWGTLTYTVADIQIIQPHEVERIKIQPNRDLLTLLTCHPYASGGRQRYVVYCERTEVR
jgi:LPXTG-site transpeptidase (sortase) family protein